MAAVARVRLMVQMLSSPTASYEADVGLFRIEVNDFRNLVINPNQKVEVLGHGGISFGSAGSGSRLRSPPQLHRHLSMSRDGSMTSRSSSVAPKTLRQLNSRPRTRGFLGQWGGYTPCTNSGTCSQSYQRCALQPRLPFRKLSLSGAHRQLVGNPSDSRRRPGRRLGLIPLRP